MRVRSHDGEVKAFDTGEIAPGLASEVHIFAILDHICIRVCMHKILMGKQKVYCLLQFQGSLQAFTMLGKDTEGFPGRGW